MTTDAHNGVTFLCGKIKPDSEGLISLGIICLRDDKEIRVSPRDPGLRYIVPGRLRMVIVHDGKIIAVFGRPRIKLLLVLGSGVIPTRDLLDFYMPMYPKPGKIPRTSRKVYKTWEYHHGYGWVQTLSTHSTVYSRTKIR